MTVRAQLPPHSDTSPSEIVGPGASYALVHAGTLGENGAPMRDVALALVAGGWPVFPCGQDKAPLVGGGFKARSRDPEKVRLWWTTYPEAMPAIVPGDCGFAALDVDSTKAAEAVRAAGFSLAEGFIVETGGTSQPFELDGEQHRPIHAYIVAAEQPKLPGVVVRFQGGYVIAPGARRGDRVYRVAHAGQPEAWTAPAPIPAMPQRAELLERVGAAVACIPNTESTDREQYVAVAHMVKGAVGEAGHDIFMAWAAKYPGAVDPDEDARVFDTISAPRTGWPELWRYASLHGFDASAEIAADARNDFGDEPPPQLVLVEDTRSKVQRLLADVNAAKDNIDRYSAMRLLRKMGFGNGEINSMLFEAGPTRQEDYGTSLGYLLDHPELDVEPKVVLPHLAWSGLKTLVSSREKMGKSTLAMAAAAAATRGDVFLGVQTTKQRVLWVTEEPRVVCKLRSHAFGCTRDDFFILPMGYNTPSRLLGAVAHWAPTLVVIDTLYRFAGVEDENDASVWTPLMNLFDQVTATSASLLLLVHAIKHSEKGEYRGSSAIGGFVDAILEMSVPKNGGNIRQLAGRGRLHFGKPFAVRCLNVDKGEFDMCADVDTRKTQELEHNILTHVKENPGQLKTHITKSVSGNATMKSTVFDALVARAEIELVDEDDKESGYRVADVFTNPDAQA